MQNSPEAVGMIQARRLQRSFGDGLIAAEVKDLHDAWMPHADAILADDAVMPRSTKLWHTVIPTVAVAAGRVSPPR